MCHASMLPCIAIAEVCDWSLQGLAIAPPPAMAAAPFTIDSYGSDEDATLENIPGRLTSDGELHYGYTVHLDQPTRYQRCTLLYLPPSP